jgi:undecaprenyl pyrophosphate synthase
MRNPTVLVRTGAKKWNRTSGAFMGRETEIHFTETLWPDFSLDSLKKLIEWVKKKEHTYGL